MGVLADELVELIAGSATWPLASEMNVRAAIRLWKAFRENDRDVLKAEAGWTNQAERYMVDPLPERLSGAFGGLLFGSQPTVKTSDRADQERMDEGLRLMRWGSRLRVAEERNSSEGEIYWRLVCDPDRFEAPTLTWHSRLDVVPHFLAQQLRAVAFVNTLNEVTDDDKGIIWRHFEVHDDTTVRNAEGYAQSGTALRMRMIPSTVERERRIGPWDDELDTILLRWQQLDALSTEQGGFGTTWSAAADPPAVTLGDPLPVDEVEDSTRLASLRAANVISIEQAVRERRPDWDDDQVDEEVARIQADQQATGATPPGAGLTGGQGDTAPADLPDTGSVDLGGGVSVTADAAGFEVAGLAGPDAPAGGAAG
jgi:hypothetical protein